MLTLLLKQIEIKYGGTQPYLFYMYQALFTAVYYRLFRVSKLTSGLHPVLARDVHIADNKNKLMFILRHSKTHTLGDKPQIIKITSEPKMTSNNQILHSKFTSYNQICPFKILSNYLGVRRGFRSFDEPFFVFRDKAPVTPHNFRSLLKESVIKLGLETKFYGSHSFRASRAVDLWKLQVPISIISKLGRWNSKCVYEYLKNY